MVWLANVWCYWPPGRQAASVLHPTFAFHPGSALPATAALEVGHWLKLASCGDWHLSPSNRRRMRRDIRPCRFCPDLPLIAICEWQASAKSPLSVPRSRIGRTMPIYSGSTSTAAYKVASLLLNTLQNCTVDRLASLYIGCSVWGLLLTRIRLMTSVLVAMLLVPPPSRSASGSRIGRACEELINSRSFHLQTENWPAGTVQDVVHALSCMISSPNVSKGSQCPTPPGVLDHCS